MLAELIASQKIRQCGRSIQQQVEEYAAKPDLECINAQAMSTVEILQTLDSVEQLTIS